MYTIELIRRVPGSSVPKLIAGNEPDAETPKEAIVSGHRIFTAQGEELNADGFQVRDRKSGHVVRTWYADNGSSVSRRPY